MDFKIASSSKFISQLNSMPRSIQKNFEDFNRILCSNPESSGLHIEPLRHPTISNVYSGRINQDVRVIMLIDDVNGIRKYLLLWIDKHDAAYEWIARRRAVGSLVTNNLELIFIPENKQVVYDNNLFNKYSDKQLLDIGSSEAQLNFIRSIKTVEDFDNLDQDYFQTRNYEALYQLAHGNEYQDVLDEYNLYSITPNETTNEVDNNPLSCIHFINDDEKIDNFFSQTIEKWRIFLHPNQEFLAKNSFNGSIKVLGEAGTGKTVVAMHRANILASRGKKVLFTTFTKNLVYDIEENLKKIMSFRDIANVEVINIDSIAYNLFKKYQPNNSVIYDKANIINKFKEVLEEKVVEPYITPSFLYDEWEFVTTSLLEVNQLSYLSCNRVGRNVPLNRKKRMEVWKLFDAYLLKCEVEHFVDNNLMMKYVIRDFKKDPKKQTYDSVIVDEAQDLGTNDFILLRLLAGEPHQDDMVIVGDSHQRIYKSHTSLAKCGINVRGRGHSYTLKINYRTTLENYNYAIQVLNNLNFDDLDDDVIKYSHCRSLCKGPEPIVCDFKTNEEQLEYIFNEVQKQINNKINPNEICVIARNKEDLHTAYDYFNRHGLDVAFIDNNVSTSSLNDGVRFATMHRVKGLEFKIVFAINIKTELYYTDIYEEENIQVQQRKKQEKCLLYVTLTRAKLLTYVTSVNDTKLKHIVNKSHTITKSDFIQYLSCKRLYYASLNKYEELKYDNEMTSAIYNGNEVGKVGRSYCGDFTLVDDNNIKDKIKKTYNLIKDGVANICEASFLYNDLYCAVDLLVNKQNNEVEIYEVKSSKSLKDTYIYDIAFQYYVLTKLGYKVSKACVLNLNPNYIFHTSLEIKSYFKENDLLDKCVQLNDQIDTILNEMRSLKEEPILVPLVGCKDCPLFNYCYKDLPEHNIFNLSGLRKKESLYSQGIISYDDLIKSNLEKNKKIHQQIDFELHDLPLYIDKIKVKEYLDKLKYPLYYLDFETTEDVVPFIDNSESSFVRVTQYSLHIQKEPGGPLEHKEYLQDAHYDNLEEVSLRLIDDLGTEGSILVYNQSFEETRIHKLGTLLSQYKSKLEKIIKRLFDLEIPFKNRNIYCKEMKGRSSIKYVLPALCKECSDSYKSLDTIHNGADAMMGYISLINSKGEEHEHIKQCLLKYCELDTYAMVAILQKIFELLKD